MEAPPNYPYMPPRKNSNSKLIWGIVIAVVSVCCLGIAGVGYFLYSAVGKVTPLFGCGDKFQDIRTAVMHYADGHGGKLPKAATWQDDIQPDLQQILLTIRPEKRPFGTITANGDFSCSLSKPPTGIAFNSNLSGKSLADIKDKEKTVLLYEIRTAMKNSNGPYMPVTEAAPLVMGAPRDWFVANVEGEIKLGFGNSKTFVFGEDGMPRNQDGPR
jgi:hypothetical protein